jgi:hypothetical protein
MAKPREKYRNLKLAGHTAAKHTAKLTEKAAAEFGGWITSNPTGSCIPPHPSMGFLAALWHILTDLVMRLLIIAVGMAFTCVWFYFIFSFALPYFIWGHL